MSTLRGGFHPLAVHAFRHLYSPCPYSIHERNLKAEEMTLGHRWKLPRQRTEKCCSCRFDVNTACAHKLTRPKRESVLMMDITLHSADPFLCKRLEDRSLLALIPRVPPPRTPHSLSQFPSSDPFASYGHKCNRWAVILVEEETWGVLPR